MAVAKLKRFVLLKRDGEWERRESCERKRLLEAYARELEMAARRKESASEAIGRNVEELLRTEFSIAEGTDLVRRLEGGDLLRIDVVHHDKRGTRRDVQSTVVALRDSNGRLKGTLGVLRDITERKRAEQDREHYLAQIEEANEAKDLFF
jgi:PAS domain-containing protein